MLAFLMVTVGFSLFDEDSEAETGGPDEYGYVWVDSKGSAPNVTFDWIDVRSGTDAGFSYSTNEFLGPFNVGFMFEFYGNTYNSFFISNNGFITLGAGATDTTNDPIPSASSPNNLIAPFWDEVWVDYYPYNTGDVYYETIGASPNRQLVVQWDNVSRRYSYDLLTFEVILNETGEVWFQYKDMNTESGLSATVGIENIDGSIGCEYSYEEAVIEDELAIMFSRGPVGFGPDSTGTGYPGDTVIYVLILTNAQDFVDSFDIQVNWSLLGWGVSICDDMGVPLTDENNNTIPDTGNLTANDSFTVHAYVEIPLSPTAQMETTVLMASSYADPAVNDTATLATWTAQAVYDPPHVDAAVDGDSDGDFDYLVVNVSLNVLGEGDLRAYCYLYTETGEQVQFVLESDWFPVGPGNLTVQFTGEYIFSAMENGTFRVDLYLYDSDWSYLGFDQYTTSYYNYTDFDTPEAIFFPPHSDFGWDDDSDSLYDYLVIEVVIQVYDDGEYTVEAYLEDDWGYSVSYAEHTEAFVAGTYIIEILFPGWEVNLADMDGPYYAYLYLDNVYGTNIDIDTHETAAYVRSEFEGVPVVFLPPHSDYANDTDDDSYYNELTIEIRIDCSETGYYDLEIYVEDYWYQEFYHVLDTLYLEDGMTALYQITLDSYSIRSNGVNGRFMLDMYLFNTSTSYEYDYDYYETQYYWVSDFDPIGAFFEPPYDDFGRDDDLDGLFDYLVITVPINASSTGYFDFEVYVYDPYWSYVRSSVEELYIVENSLFEATVEIDSYTISDRGIDGSWNVYIYIYDHWTAVLYDSDTYTTQTYYVNDFDPVPVQFEPPHTDYGLDTDEDTYFDYLIVEAMFLCYQAGRFTFRADLYDPWGSPVTSVQITRDYSAGVRMVEFSFDGWMIWYNGVSGWFEIDLSVESLSGLTLDTDTHYSDYYYWNEFEPAPAEFVTPHTDQAMDDDEDGLYEYLVVAATVEVYVEGVYAVAGTLYDDWGYVTDSARNTTHLPTGTAHVELWFDGWLVALMDADPWRVLLTLSNAQGDEMDSDTYYLSGIYWRSDFDPMVPELESGWAYGAPVIDGALDADEWFGAGMVDFVLWDEANEVDAAMYVINNETHLFVCIDAVGDTTGDDGDSASLAFDTGNDELATDFQEDQFVLTSMGSWTDSQHLIYDTWDWTVDCRPFDQGLPQHETLAGVVGFGPSEASSTAHRIYEICIPLDLLGAGPGDVIGFATASVVELGVVDSDDGSFSAWPARYQMGDELEKYGDLVLSPERPLTTFEIDGTEGDNGWFVSDAVVTLSATGGVGGINTTHLRIDGGAWTEYTSPVTVSGDGVHTVLFYSVDMSDVEEPVRALGIMIDTEEPDTSADVEGTVGSDDWYIADVLVVFETLDDASGVRGIMCRLNGGDWINVSEGFLDVSEDGAYLLEYYAVDVAGHEEDIKSIALKVDINAPVTFPEVDGSRVTLNVTDSGSGVYETLYRIDDGEWTTYTGPFEVRGEGNHTVEFFSQDVAGNNETIKSVIVQGSTSASVLGMDLWLALLVLTLVVVTILALLFVVRRRVARPPRGPPMPPDARLYEQQMPPQGGVEGGAPPEQGRGPPPNG
ncbi:MAG: hypothetical protein JSV90_04855 [Methanobacteriota archaeon]|nr:MAG: hypothetical protein JSV90_04855 [Euryarchaeota archaeon]